MTPTTMYDMHELRRAVKNLTAPLMMTLYLHIFHVLKSPRVPHNAKCVRNEPTCSAERLCKSMKGLGTDDSSLIGVIVPCSEIDVLDIRREFLTTYGKSLYSFMKMASAGPVVHELPSLGNSPVWLEGKRQELNVKTTQLSARNDLILESVFDVLQENEIHGLKRELTQHAIEKLMENSVWMPNWVLETMARYFSWQLLGFLGAMWSSGCWRKSGPQLSLSGISPRRSLPLGKSAVPPKSLLSCLLKCDHRHLLSLRKWMRTKVKLSCGYSFTTWTERSPRPSTCRRSPAKPSAVSNWRCGATGETQNAPACTEWKFTTTRKRQQRFLEGNN